MSVGLAEEREMRLRRVDLAIGVVALIVCGAVLLDLLARGLFTTEQMLIVRPLLATVAAYSAFTYVLSVRSQTHVFGEIGFIYLSMALAYTVLPGLTILALDFFFPVLVDGQNIVDLAPTPGELGIHFWRHFLFVAAVGVGYVLVRGRPVAERGPDLLTPAADPPDNQLLVWAWVVMIGTSMVIVSVLSAPVTTYIEHYTRFEHLGWLARRIVYVCMAVKSGGYYVLLALLFDQYRRYRTLLLVVVPVIGVYEGVFSFGARIEILTILLAVVGLYHFRVARVSLRKGAIYLTALAVLFSGLGLFRASGYDLRATQSALTAEGGQQLAEFGAVYNTGFHLYAERDNRTLPARPWPMFFWEVIAVVPLVDHITYHPQYWYARNYFPEAAVPPQTMGVIADSALWGGEVDLLIRSLINGALFALLARWFQRRRHEFVPLTIYVFACATSVLTLKYSVLYQAVPILKILVPTLILSALLSRILLPRSAPRAAS